MSQIAQPVMDVSVNGWTPVPIYAQINDTYPGDATFVSSQPNPQGNAFEVDFPVLAQPVAGTHQLTVRMRATDVTPVSVRVALRMGVGGAVATRVFTPTQSFADYVITLTSGEIAAIRDYRDLRLSVEAGPITTCTQCQAMPLQWQFTLSGVINNSGCFNCGSFNTTVTLTYTGQDDNGSADCFNLCTWDSGGPTFVGNVDHCLGIGIGERWFLTYQNFNGVNGWHLVTAQSCSVSLSGGAAGADYVFLGPGPFNCLGSNVMTSNGPSYLGPCNMPNTITLNPV